MVWGEQCHVVYSVVERVNWLNYRTIGSEWTTRLDIMNNSG